MYFSQFTKTVSINLCKKNFNAWHHFNTDKFILPFFIQKYEILFEIIRTYISHIPDIKAQNFISYLLQITVKTRKNEGKCFAILVQRKNLKGVFAKNERGYRLNAIKKRFRSLLILLLYVASIRRKLLKTTNTEERNVLTNSERCNIQLGS